MEGSVNLKRKTSWVRRFAKVGNCEFSYRNSASDRNPKVVVNLLKARVYISPAGEERRQSMIYIQADPLKSEVIRVIFDSELQFGQWLQAIRENCKTDDELREISKSMHESFHPRQAAQKSRSETRREVLVDGAPPPHQ